MNEYLRNFTDMDTRHLSPELEARVIRLLAKRRRQEIDHAVFAAEAAEQRRLLEQRIARADALRARIAEALGR